jgi:hypothetical protein
VSRLTPSWWAFTAVAPIVRFNALDILVTPVFFFASDFSSRTSDEVQARRVTVFLVGIISSLFVGRAFYHTKLGLQRAACCRAHRNFMTNYREASFAFDPFSDGRVYGHDFATIITSQFSNSAFSALEGITTSLTATLLET